MIEGIPFGFFVAFCSTFFSLALCAYALVRSI